MGVEKEARLENKLGLEKEFRARKLIRLDRRLFLEKKSGLEKKLGLEMELGLEKEFRVRKLIRLDEKLLLEKKSGLEKKLGLQVNYWVRNNNFDRIFSLSPYLSLSLSLSHSLPLFLSPSKPAVKTAADPMRYGGGGLLLSLSLPDRDFPPHSEADEDPQEELVSSSSVRSETREVRSHGWRCRKLCIQKIDDAIINEALFLGSVGQQAEDLKQELTWMENFLQDADAEARGGNNVVQNWVKLVRKASLR